VGTYGVLMDVGAAGFEVSGVEDEVVGEASLPNGEFGGRREKPPLIKFIACEMVLSFGVRSRWAWSGMTTKEWSLYAPSAR